MENNAKLKSKNSTIGDLLFIVGFVFFLYSLSAFEIPGKQPPVKNVTEKTTVKEFAALNSNTERLPIV